MCHKLMFYVIEIFYKYPVEIMGLCFYPNSHNTNMWYVTNIILYIYTKRGQFVSHPYVRISNVSPNFHLL